MDFAWPSRSTPLPWPAAPGHAGYGAGLVEPTGPDQRLLRIKSCVTPKPSSPVYLRLVARSFLDGHARTLVSEQKMTPAG
jgi:hypothetical protein